MTALARFFFAWTAIAIAMIAAPAHADDAISDLAILGRPRPYFRLESVRMRISTYEQGGLGGYQSQAGPTLGRGSERMTVLQPQIEAVFKQGERLTHRVWVPIDVVTAASPDAIDRTPASVDVVSNSSRQNTGGAIDWTTTYKADAKTELFVRDGFHLEENFRSWNGGMGVTRSFAEDNATLSASFNAYFDWFDRFDITGHRHGRTSRSTSNGNVGFSQLLSTTTIARLDYGLTVQSGELGNTWNSVPLAIGERGPEIMPDRRVRQALSGRLVQGLPWNGSIRASYRFYTDTWGIDAHTVELQLMQRLTPWAYVRGVYRVHTQDSAVFFTTLAPNGATLRTADSDLDKFVAQTWGAHAAIDLPDPRLKTIHFDFGYERYFRSNGMTVNMFTWSTGFRF